MCHATKRKSKKATEVYIRTPQKKCRMKIIIVLCELHTEEKGVDSPLLLRMGRFATLARSDLLGGF